MKRKWAKCTMVCFSCGWTETGITEVIVELDGDSSIGTYIHEMW